MKARAFMTVCVLIVAAIAWGWPEVIYMAFAALGFCFFCCVCWAAWQVRKAFPCLSGYHP